MTRRNLVYIFIGLILGLIGSSRLPLHAQKRAQSEAVEATAKVKEAPYEVDSESVSVAAKVSLQDALQRSYSFEFGRPTPLAEVSRRLSSDLGGPVVLDLAALERLDLKPDDTVQLELKGVRLKTGLKLLLDQQGLTFRIIAEDNLMILTDKEGSDDPLDKVWTELSHLHRDVHDIQDAVDELYELSIGPGELEMEGGPRLRKPTIIEEMPTLPGGGPAPGTGSLPEPRSDTKDAPPATTPKRPRTRL